MRAHRHDPTSEKVTVPHRTKGEPIARLLVEVRSGPDAGTRITSEEDQIAIGSAPGNHLMLQDETVSRHHLELTRAKDRIRVRDLGSTNGVGFGGAMIENGVVPPGSVLRVGRTTLAISDAGQVSLPFHREESYGDLVGRSPSMRRLMARIERAAASPASVLMIGETGTGKELIARAIHDHGARASRPFETVDCAALLPTLMASELFGHERGAFTGADRRHIGAFERADGGTLFLDEIGEVPLQLQPALLGALERRAFRRVGGTETIRVDVRVVAATHRDLRREVNGGGFREDLYYRLAIVTLAIPALRERPEDIPLLVEHFLPRAGFYGGSHALFSPRAMDALCQHHWPGNVRELRNYVESAVAMGEVSAPESATSDGRRRFDDLLRLRYGEGRSTILAEFEAAYVSALLERNRGNVSSAAREAEMNRSYLIRMLRRHRTR